MIARKWSRHVLFRLLHLRTARAALHFCQNAICTRILDAAAAYSVPLQPHGNYNTLTALIEQPAVLRAGSGRWSLRPGKGNGVWTYWACVLPILESTVDFFAVLNSTAPPAKFCECHHTQETNVSPRCLFLRVPFSCITFCK